ncbi:MAG: RNA polymerase sigma factor [Solirubrobacterales bacterium]
MMLSTRAAAKRLSRLADPTADGLAIEDLARRAQEGDERAVAEIYRRYFDRVYGYMRVALKESHEAEDAARQVFLKAIGLISGYEQRKQPFSRWLFRIARNEELERLRERDPVGSDPDAGDRWRDSVRTDELRSRLWYSDGELMRAIEELPEAQQRAVMLRYVLDFEDAEIAEVLSMNPREVRQLQRSALGMLGKRVAVLPLKDRPQS